MAFLCGGCQAYQTIPLTFHKQTKSTKKKKQKKRKKRKKKNNKENNTEKQSPTVAVVARDRRPGTHQPRDRHHQKVGDDGYNRRPGATDLLPPTRRSTSRRAANLERAAAPAHASTTSRPPSAPPDLELAELQPPRPAALLHHLKRVPAPVGDRTAAAHAATLDVHTPFPEARGSEE